MNLHQRLLVCEAMLARLDVALARADAEMACAAAAERHMDSLVTRLRREHERTHAKIGLLPRTTRAPQDCAANEI
jgi:hypothetical protein